MRHESPPRVRLEAVFARDFDRRMRLVIDLLRREIRRHEPPLTASNITEPRPRALAAAANQPRR